MINDFILPLHTTTYQPIYIRVCMNLFLKSFLEIKKPFSIPTIRSSPHQQTAVKKSLKRLLSRRFTIFTKRAF